MASLRRLLTARETAVILNLSVEAVWRYSRMGVLPTVHVGRQKRFDETEMREWKEKGGCQRVLRQVRSPFDVSTKEK